MKSLQLHKPHLLVVIGLPGAGKSFFASQFAETFNAPYLDYEHYVTLIRDEKIAYELSNETLDQLLRTQQTVIIDGRGTTRADRRVLAKYAKAQGYETLLIWVQTEPLTAEHRAVTGRSAKMSAAEFDDRVNRFEIPTPTEQTIVISGKHTHASQARIVLKKLVAAKKDIEDHPHPSPSDRTIRKHGGRIIVR